MQDQEPKYLPEQDSHIPGDLPDLSAGDTSERLRMFTTPLSKRGWPIWLVYLAAGLGLVYVLNPTLGLLEFIPDNLPFIGNLDEGAAFLLMWFGIVEYLEGKKKGGSS